MPEELQNEIPSISPTLEKPKRNWKKISLLILIGLLLISLVGIGLYLLIPGLNQEPPSQTQKPATPSTKPKPKTTKIIWVKGKEIWIKDRNTDGTKFFAEDKKILDWDLLGNDKIVYITAVEKSKDEIYGTEIISLDLKTKNREILYEKDLDKIISERIPCLSGTKFNDNQEDASISTLSVTPDNKSIIFASEGIWSLDLQSKKVGQLLKTDDFSIGKGECLSYRNLKVVNKQSAELFISGFEGFTKGLIDIKNKKLLEKYSTGWYSTILQVSFPPKDQIFIKSISHSYTQHGSVIGEGTGKDSYKVDEEFYSTENYISTADVSGSKVFFVEAEDTETDPNGQPYTFSLHVLDLNTKGVSKISGINLEGSSEFDIKCMTSDQANVYMGIIKENSLEISSVDLASRGQKVIEKIQESESEKVVDCFQVTNF